MSNHHLVSYRIHACPNVTSFATLTIVADTSYRTAELGLSIDDAADAGVVTHLYCHSVTVDVTCPACRLPCWSRDHVERQLMKLLIARHPSILHARLSRTVCGNEKCEITIFRAPIPQVDDDQQSMTRRGDPMDPPTHGH